MCNEYAAKWYSDHLDMKLNNNFYRGLCSLFMFSQVSVHEYMDNRIVQVVRVSQWAKEGFVDYAEFGIKFEGLDYLQKSILADISAGKDKASDWGLSFYHFCMLKDILKSDIISTLMGMRESLKNGGTKGVCKVS